MDQIVNLAMFTMDRTVTQSAHNVHSVTVNAETRGTPLHVGRRVAVADMTARHLCRNTLAESVRHQR